MPDAASILVRECTAPELSTDQGVIVRRDPVEASALPASVGLARARVGLGVSLLRLRSDEQLVSLFRAGNEEAFRVIHDRYRARMHAYARQMLSSASADAEDVVQEIFVRAYAGLRTNRRDLALRAWLYRIAHNRCIDELRRPQAIAVETVDELGESTHADPHLRAEQREALRRLIADVQRLPDQQRSALLMRELGGMPYADLSGALGVSVPAVKSLLVRARVGLVQASDARDTDCAEIRDDLIVAHDRGVRASGRARRHMRDCTECRRFRKEVHGVSRRFALLLPALGPIGVAAKLLGIGSLGGGGAAAGSSTGAAAGSTAAAAGSTGAAASGGAAVAGGGAAVASGGAVAAGGSAVVAGGGALAAAGTGHVVTIIAATVVAAGSAIGIQQASAPHHHTAARMAQASIPTPSRSAPRTSGSSAAASVTRDTGTGSAPSSVSTAGGSSSTVAGDGQSNPSQARTPLGATERGPRGGFTAGTTSASTAVGTGEGTGTTSTTPTTTTGAPTTTTTVTTTTGTATSTTTSTPVPTAPTSTVPTTDPPAGAPGSSDPTSTATTPGTSEPTSTSAATSAAHTGSTGGGSTLVPLRPTRSGGGALRGRHGAGLGGGITASR
jgi:RNA polymerase sigma factor (sigma-70 family)